MLKKDILYSIMESSFWRVFSTVSTKYELLIWFYIPVTKMLKILL